MARSQNARMCPAVPSPADFQQAAPFPMPSHENIYV